MRFVKRKELTQSTQIKIIIYALVLSFFLISLMMVLLKESPIKVYQTMIQGAFGSSYRFKETINQTSLLVIASLGIALALKMKFSNVGGEGQIMMGGIFATYFALNFKQLPSYLLLPLMFIAAFIGGALWASIATWLKLQFNINETIITLMLNYIAIQLVVILEQGIWKDPMSLGYPKIPNFVKNAQLPKVLGINSGWIMMIILVILVDILFKKVKLGYEMSVLGESKDTARYAGMNVKVITILTVFLSGALLGLVGFIQASGNIGTLNSQLSAGIGFTAVMIAWIAKLKPRMIVLVGFVFAIIGQGAIYMETVLNLSSSISLVIQGIILFCILGSDIFMNYTISKKQTKAVIS